MRAGMQASFTCTLSEAVPVGEATWYINGAAVQPDDTDWTVTADGSHHALMLSNAQPQHAGEVTFAARDAVASARLSVLGEWVAEVPPLRFGSGAHLIPPPDLVTIQSWLLCSSIRPYEPVDSGCSSSCCRSRNTL